MKLQEGLRDYEESQPDDSRQVEATGAAKARCELQGLASCLIGRSIPNDYAQHDVLQNY
jgi:hypothetical protein